MASALDSYAPEFFDQKLKQTIYSLSNGAQVEENPHAWLLGGQSGAGKTRLHRICSNQLGGNAIVINGDEYRRSHPHFAAIQKQFGDDAPAHTAQWSGAMTEALIQALSRQGFNLIIEGTLRTSSVPLKTAQLLRDRGYAVSLALMAVKPEISLISCQIRYEMMRIAGTTPRATDPAHHEKIVREIAGNLSELEESGLFDGVYIYNRAAELLYPAKGCSSASKTLQDILFGPWTPEEEEHYANLKLQLHDLKAIS